MLYGYIRDPVGRNQSVLFTLWADLCACIQRFLKKVVLAVPLDYLTRGQYVMCKRKKKTSKGAPRYGLTHARNHIHDIAIGPLYGQNRSNQSPMQLFHCRHEGLLPSDDAKTAARKTRTLPSFQKPPLFNFQIIWSKFAYFTLINYQAWLFDAKEEHSMISIGGKNGIYIRFGQQVKPWTFQNQEPIAQNHRAILGSISAASLSSRVRSSHESGLILRISGW